MSISTTVKALISMVGIKQGDLAPVLGVNSVQAVSNKFRLGQWKASDLVNIANHCGCRLAFVMDDGTILPISAADPVGADPVQASPAAGAGQGIPCGVLAGAESPPVTLSCNRGEEKPLSD